METVDQRQEIHERKHSKRMIYLPGIYPHPQGFGLSIHHRITINVVEHGIML